MEGRGAMTTVPISLQDLRRRLYGKAKAEKEWRFWGLDVPVTKLETLRTADAVAKKHNGAPGLDGVTFAALKGAGVELFLAELRDALVSRTSRPRRNRHVAIPKEGGTVRGLGILVDGYRHHDGLLRAAHQRLHEELATLHLRVNADKTRIVDLRQGESFGFLGFDFRRVRSRRGAWRPQYTPTLTQRTAVLHKLKAVFQRLDSQPIRRVIAELNPILRGWGAYFRIGHASRGFAYVKLCALGCGLKVTGLRLARSSRAAPRIWTFLSRLLLPNGWCGPRLRAGGCCSRGC
jgi:hypothetical protein